MKSYQAILLGALAVLGSSAQNDISCKVNSQGNIMCEQTDALMLIDSNGLSEEE
jgi:hypothetical protein